MKIDLDMITDGWWSWDLTRPDYEYMSPRFWRTMGYDSEKMPHSPKAWQSIIHPEDARRVEKTLHRHIENGEPFQILVRYRHALGHTVWVICRGQAVFRKGRPVEMIGAHQDVTGIVRSGDPDTGEISLHSTSKSVLQSVERMLGLLEQHE